MQGQLVTPYEKRAQLALNPAGKQLLNLMANKKTNLILSNDETDSVRFLELAEKIGPEIAVLKTHIDIIENFSPEITKKLSEISKRHNFMIFEDRKFADIGNTVKLQYSKGIYKISSWANFVNLHILPGPEIIEAINMVIKETKDNLSRGVILLAQMSSAGNLLTKEYTEKCVEWANKYKEEVAGFIANGSNPEELRFISSKIFDGHVIFTPGIQIGSKGDSLGQQYATPESAVSAGSDCIIVGRGIIKSDNPLETAKVYREEGWEAYLKRVMR
jgi:orotidine 5'-phosphate decarboxylase subfamily 1